jgi:beta-aspartyl-peptidase (threonine type)
MRLLLCLCLACASVPVRAAEIAFALPGGAGAMPRAELTPEREQAVRADLARALKAGHAILAGGGSALDAVVAAIVVLEDSPRFNAGKGAVFNADGKNELDASIMDGATMKAGAIAAVHRVKNPIRLARAVMDQSQHVMLIGDGAEAFAKSVGIELVSPDYFHTKYRWDQLQKAKASERSSPRAELPRDLRLGTVGAVALDREGRLAAGTSTGGMTNKRWGRVGDSPIIGAGTYANDRCAVSATCWGEFYIRAAAAHDICARVAYRGDAIPAAADAVVQDAIPKLGGDGGVIALDRDGHVAFSFNTEGMYRGTIDAGGEIAVDIYK